MCVDDCGRPSRRQVLVGGAAAVTVAACGASSAPPPAPAAPAPLGPVTARKVTYPNGSGERTGWVFRPETPARLPIVLVAQGNPGFLDYLDAFCRRIAGHGYTVMFVDFFGTMPPMPKDPVAQAEWRKHLGRATAWYAAATDFDAAVQWLDARGLGDAGAVAGIGFCGGATALAHHVARGAKLRGLILFYVNARLTRSFRDADDPLPDLLELTDRFGAVPIQAHYGDRDPTARSEDGHELERRLAAAGAHATFYYYPDAGHGFMKADEPLEADRTWGYVPEAAVPAEARAVEELSLRLARR
jgi:dienelactone hydrolase